MIAAPPDVAPADPDTLLQHPLTPQQDRIAGLIGEGRSYAAIADALQIEIATVRVHVRDIAEALPPEPDLTASRLVFIWAVSRRFYRLYTRGLLPKSAN